MCYEKGNEIEKGKRSYGSLNPRWMIVTKLFNWKRGWVHFIDAFLVDPVTRERAKESTFSRKHIGWLVKEKKKIRISSEFISASKNLYVLSFHKHFYKNHHSNEYEWWYTVENINENHSEFSIKWSMNTIEWNRSNDKKYSAFLIIIWLKSDQRYANIVSKRNQEEWINAFWKDT